MKTLSADTRMVLTIAKGFRMGLEDMRRFVTLHVYGNDPDKLMDQNFLCRYLREVLMEVREFTAEQMERFMFDGIRKATEWPVPNGQFSWDEFLRYHIGALMMLHIKDKNGNTILDYSLSDEERKILEKVLDKKLTF